METTLVDNKKEITAWVNRLEDKSVIDKINELMKAEKKAAFERDFARGISGDELFKRVIAHINTLPWKK